MLLLLSKLVQQHGLQLDKQVATWKKTSFGVIHRGSFAQTVADYCSMKTLMKSVMIGYIGVKSPVDTKVSTIRKYVEELSKIDTEISPYLQVVGSEVGVIMPTTNSIHYVNGATHYAHYFQLFEKKVHLQINLSKVLKLSVLITLFANFLN